MTTVAAKQQQQQQPVRSTIPARLDRLRWSPFHTRLVLSAHKVDISRNALMPTSPVPSSPSWGNVGRAAAGTGGRTHDYGSGTIPCAPRGNFARVSSGMFRCAETSFGGRWLSQLASETSS